MGKLDQIFDISAIRWSAFAILVVLSGAGSWVYGLVFFDTLKFFIGVFVLFYLPGNLLIRSVGFAAVNSLKYPVLALATGTVVVPVFYNFLRYLNYPDYYAVSLFSLCAAAWLYLVFRGLGVNKTDYSWSWLICSVC